MVEQTDTSVRGTPIDKKNICSSGFELWDPWCLEPFFFFFADVSLPLMDNAGMMLLSWVMRCWQENN